ncbi:ABC transporter ATP-binding protein [Phyllobacterium sp. SB3]|uniref:ABC transporter ATP-binding protein n=1 Tax=Phyllobacterium sp. SB3 TaxID=3156073 RepID=UPI0032AF3F92
MVTLNTEVPLLKVENLHAGYGKLEVVSDVSFHVCAGEFVTMLGRNGAGKSTTVQAISNLLTKTQGRITFGGEEITKAPPRNIARLGLSQVLQGHRVFTSLTVEDNLLLGTYIHNRRGDRTKLERVYDLFPELADRKDQFASRLSGGQQQILAVAQGVISEPSMLILDEPSGGLAPIVVDKILMIASRLTREENVAVLLIEQLIEKSLAHSDRVYVLETGKIAHSGPAKDLRDSDVLLKAYLGGH